MTQVITPRCFSNTSMLEWMPLFSLRNGLLIPWEVSDQIFHNKNPEIWSIFTSHFNRNKNSFSCRTGWRLHCSGSSRPSVWRIQSWQGVITAQSLVWEISNKNQCLVGHSFLRTAVFILQDLALSLLSITGHPIWQEPHDHHGCKSDLSGIPESDFHIFVHFQNPFCCPLFLRRIVFSLAIHLAASLELFLWACTGRSGQISGHGCFCGAWPQTQHSPVLKCPGQFKN